MAKTETDFSGEFMEHVKEHLVREHTVLKHCDRFTVGIPDISVSSDRQKTVWIESKRIKNVRHSVLNLKHWIKSEETLQLNTLARLNGFYMVYNPIHNEWLFVSGRRAYLHYRTNEPLIPAMFNEPEFLHKGDRKVFFQKVVEYLQKEL